MGASDEIRALLKEQLMASLEEGLYYFEGGWCSNLRIPPESLYPLQAGWSQLAADAILEQPSSGVVGLRLWHEDGWIRHVARVLDEREIELPTSELDTWSGQVWGVPLAAYPPGSQVTALVDVHTLGGQVRTVKQLAEAHGLMVKRAVALVDRNPRPTTEVDGVPFASVLHLPLPLYRRTQEAPPDLVWRSRSFGMSLLS